MFSMFPFLEAPDEPAIARPGAHFLFAGTLFGISCFDLRCRDGTENIHKVRILEDVRDICWVCVELLPCKQYTEKAKKNKGNPRRTTAKYIVVYLPLLLYVFGQNSSPRRGYDMIL